MGTVVEVAVGLFRMQKQIVGGWRGCAQRRLSRNQRYAPSLALACTPSRTTETCYRRQSTGRHDDGTRRQRETQRDETRPKPDRCSHKRSRMTTCGLSRITRKPTRADTVIVPEPAPRREGVSSATDAARGPQLRGGWSDVGEACGPATLAGGLVDAGPGTRAWAAPRGLGGHVLAVVPSRTYIFSTVLYGRSGDVRCRIAGVLWPLLDDVRSDGEGKVGGFDYCPPSLCSWARRVTG